MYIQRQFGADVVTGDDTDLVTSTISNYVWQLTDTNQRYVLVIDPGKYVQGTIDLAASASYSIQLPNTYDSANRLFVMIRSDLTIKVVTVSPFDPTSTFLVRAGVEAGQDGIYSSQGRVTSITVSNPQSETATVEYFLFEQPDLSLADSFRDGQIATGVQTDNDIS